MALTNRVSVSSCPMNPLSQRDVSAEQRSVWSPVSRASGPPETEGGFHKSVFQAAAAVHGLSMGWLVRARVGCLLLSAAQALQRLLDIYEGSL